MSLPRNLARVDVRGCVACSRMCTLSCHSTRQYRARARTSSCLAGCWKRRRRAVVAALSCHSSSRCLRRLQWVVARCEPLAARQRSWRRLRGEVRTALGTRRRRQIVVSQCADIDDPYQSPSDTNTYSITDTRICSCMAPYKYANALRHRHCHAYCQTVTCHGANT